MGGTPVGTTTAAESVVFRRPPNGGTAAVLDDRGGESPSQLEPEFALSFAIDESGTASEPLRVALEGRIDRLELYRAGHSGPIRKIKVVDYKTSRNLSGYADKLKNELGVTDFQIPVYALGALTSFKGELAPDATGLHVGLGHHGRHGDQQRHPQDDLQPVLDLVAAAEKAEHHDSQEGRGDGAGDGAGNCVSAIGKVSNSTVYSVNAYEC